MTLTDAQEYRSSAANRPSKTQVSMRELVAGLALLLVASVCISPAKCSAQECGDNPMKEVLQVAKRTGKSLSHVLTLLRGIDQPAYSSLAKEFRYYAACVGLVDTGYFRKRSDPAMHDNQNMFKAQDPPLEANVEFVPSNEKPASLDSYRKWMENYKSALMLRQTLRDKPDYFLAALYRLRKGEKS